MIKQPFLIWGAILCAYSSILLGCGPSRLMMKVESFGNTEARVEKYERFAFLPVNIEKPLMEKHTFLIIKNIMGRKGYVYDELTPQFLIAVQVASSTREVQQEVRSRPVQVYQPPPIGSRPGIYGTYQTQFIATGGGTDIVNIRWMKIDFIDAIDRKPSDKISYIWQGEVSSDDHRTMKRMERRGQEVDKCLIWGLLQDYPNKQGPALRRIEIDKCE